MRARTPRIRPSASSAISISACIPRPCWRREEVLEAVLGPLHRAAEVDRGDRGDDHLRRRVALRPERPADVGHDHADRLPRAVEDVRELRERAVRVLGRAPHGEQAGLAVLDGDRAARLDRHGRDPRHPVAPGDDVRGPGEGAVDVAAGVRPAHERLVRRAGVDDRLERVVVDLDLLGDVLGQRARRGDDPRDGLARRSGPRRPAAPGAGASETSIPSMAAFGYRFTRPARSSGVTTANTPGGSAGGTRTAPTRAYACGLRTNAMWAMSASSMSST